MSQKAIRLDHVSRLYGQGRDRIRAVDDVSLSIGEGETLCLVGESGCGKSTTGRLVAGLIEPSGGRVLYGDTDIRSLRDREGKRFRRAVQIIHQDPYASLNPIRTVAQTLAAPLRRHGLAGSSAASIARLRELLEIVGLVPPDDYFPKYPHQLSGGQRQRVSVARALTVEPEVIVADEAVSMVDVSLRVSLLNMLLRLQRELGVAFLFITHDLAVAKYFGREGAIGVMYLGRIVELAPSHELVRDPIHPYTQALLDALPEADPRVTRSKGGVKLRSWEIPSLAALPSGCPFHPRCPLYEEGFCDAERPAEDVLKIDGHLAACLVAARDHDRGSKDDDALRPAGRTP
ncbi:MAG: oligopeptide/dipeptide ABC transporter ATP-binding protein [Actinomycetota bacterium]